MYEVSRCDPRIKIAVLGCDAPQGEPLLFVKRVGSQPEFAVYDPIDVVSGNYTFEFDELLFMQPPGRFRGRLVIGMFEHVIEFDYVRQVTVEVS